MTYSWDITSDFECRLFAIFSPVSKKSPNLQKTRKTDEVEAQENIVGF